MSESIDNGSRGTRSDVLGVVCSVGCAIHCAATPVVLAALPSVTSVRWLADPLFHQVVALVCVTLVLRAIVPGWRIHRSRIVAFCAAAGLSLLMTAAFILPDNCCELVPTEEHDHNHSHDGHDHSHAQLNSTGAKSGTGQMLGAKKPVVTLASSKAKAVETCKDCEGESDESAHKHWSRPLLSQDRLVAYVGEERATKIASVQPYLTPIGGLFLVVAHLLNIRLSCCNSSGCKPKSDSQTPPSDILT